MLRQRTTCPTRLRLAVGKQLQQPHPRHSLGNVGLLPGVDGCLRRGCLALLGVQPAYVLGNSGHLPFVRPWVSCLANSHAVQFVVVGTVFGQLLAGLQLCSLVRPL